MQKQDNKAHPEAVRSWTATLANGPRHVALDIDFSSLDFRRRSSRDRTRKADQICLLKRPTWKNGKGKKIGMDA